MPEEWLGECNPNYIQKSFHGKFKLVMDGTIPIPFTPRTMQSGVTINAGYHDVVEAHKYVLKVILEAIRKMSKENFVSETTCLSNICF